MRFTYLNESDSTKVSELERMNPAQHTISELKDVQTYESRVQDAWVDDPMQKEHRGLYLEELYYLYRLEAEVKYGIAIMESEDMNEEGGED